MSAFTNDKALFFSGAQPLKPPSQKTLAFLIEAHDSIEKEKNALEAAFSNQHIDPLKPLTNPSNEAHREFYLYCCELLKTYHEKRGEPQSPTENWADYLHDNLGLFHAYRIMLTFARLTSELLIRIMNDAKWFERLNRSIAPIFDFDQSITILDLPVETFFILSFALLGLRFLMELKRILRHTFAPTDAEKKELSAWQRFTHEVHTYRFNLINDILWASLNLLGRHPLGNSLMLAGLCFDLGLLLYRYQLTSQSYYQQKAAYERALLVRKQDLIIQEQLKILELNHIEEKAALQLSLCAAALLPTAFSILLTASTPIVAPIGTFLCIIGTATYLAAGFYGTYQKNTHLLKQLKANGGSDAEIKHATLAQQKAFHDGWSSFGKNVSLPLLFITVLALCWPAALLLTAAYIAFEYTPKKEEPALQLAPS